jgi:hypothetical protein
VVSFMPRPLYLQGKSPRYPSDRRLGGPQSRSGRGGEEKTSYPLTGLELPVIQPVAQRYTTELTRPHEEFSSLHFFHGYCYISRFYLLRYEDVSFPTGLFFCGFCVCFIPSGNRCSHWYLFVLIMNEFKLCDFHQLKTRQQKFSSAGFPSR